jgi:hypothetical protein
VSRITVIGAIVLAIGIFSTMMMFLVPASPAYALAMLRNGAGAVLWLAFAIEAWFIATGALLLAASMGISTRHPAALDLRRGGLPAVHVLRVLGDQHLRRPDVRAEFGV